MRTNAGSNPGLRPMLIGALAFAALFACFGDAALADEKLRASHENLDPESLVDELGIWVPFSISHPARRFPAGMDFPTGPEVGERLPDFTLPDQNGEMVDFHKHRGNSKAAVLFIRSTVW